MNYLDVFKTILTKYKIEIFAITLFLLVLPLSLKVTFYQNDDWVYYQTVERFQSGNFTLHPYSGPTLYLQAFLGMMFANIFGISRLPVLTLIMACISVYILIRILKDFYEISDNTSILIGLVYFLNPIGVYELWGFMTNHYFMVFMLSSVYFFLKFDRSLSKKSFGLFILFAFLGLLIRQVALTLPLAAAGYLFLKRNIKWSTVSGISFLALYIFYSKILPLTPRIKEVPLQLENFTKNDYTFAILYGSLLVSVAYLLPLALNYIDLKKVTKNKKAIITFLFIFIASFLFLNKNFKPDEVSWGEFPYFENVFERTGLYPRGISGTKYHFRGNFDLWKYWDIGAKIVSAAVVAFLIRYNIFKNSFFVIFWTIYLLMAITTKTFYDRYVHVAIPMLILMFVEHTKRIPPFLTYLLALFVFFLTYFAYFVSMDFITVNKYVWDRSVQLVQEDSIEPSQIRGTNAWRLTYPNAQREYDYFFSYDSPATNQELSEENYLIETKAIEYPLNIFIEPKVYLYKRKNV